MKTIYLTGFMGSGKSTVGELLHRKIGVQYLDTDQLVVEKYGAIAAIFENEGENQFRHYETEVLRDVPQTGYVVSTGGGIVEREENITLMNKSGLVIYLDTSFEEVARRLGNDTERPLWGKTAVEKKKLYKRRYEWYLKTADIRISTDGKSPTEITDEIMDYLT